MRGRRTFSFGTSAQIVTLCFLSTPPAPSLEWLPSSMNESSELGSMTSASRSARPSCE